MKSILKSLASLHRDESGQGLVEYVLLIALAGLAATAGMNTLATKIDAAFSNAGALLSSYVT